MANKSVSWIRVRDDHILTVDRLTFIADDRYQAFYADSTGMWTLQIKYVQARDAGMYECQVGTEPKVSARAHLHVVGEFGHKHVTGINWTRSLSSSFFPVNHIDIYYPSFVCYGQREGELISLFHTNLI